MDGPIESSEERDPPIAGRSERDDGAVLVQSSVGIILLLGLGFAYAAVFGTNLRDSWSLLQSPELLADDAVGLETRADGDLVLRDTDIHPARIYQRYLSNQSRTPDAPSARIAREFQDLIGIYEVRQGIDDNFTLRILDNRTGGLIDIVTLDSAKAEFERTGIADWNQIDRLRRVRTRELVREHSESIDREFITVKWGRRNEILEARDRELPFVEHEVRLARALGLSLLTTEIGTVETFNNDKLVSRVGARSRYQLMPSILRELDVNHYSLQTATGRRISVREEMHPLLSMEAAFTVVRAYSNAMGHEIPGISAYHAGPFNVFRLYERYLDENNDLFTAYSTVVTAYLWGLTEGFDQVTRKTSFGSSSRSYIPSVFGALEATDDIPIDTSLTWLVECVRLRSGSSIFLGDLLADLDSLVSENEWKGTADDSTTYQRFKRLNPHIELPDFGGRILPENADVKLTSRSGRYPVRLFLPLGSADRLREAGNDLFAPEQTQSWTHGPFYNRDEKTELDVRYEALVNKGSDFSFSADAVVELDSLYFQFQQMAKENPTWYRTMQYNVIRLHRRVWRASNFEILTKSVANAKLRVDDAPLARLPELSRLSSRPTDPVGTPRLP